MRPRAASSSMGSRATMAWYSFMALSTSRDSTASRAAPNLTDGLCASRDLGRGRSSRYLHSRRYREYDNVCLRTHRAPAPSSLPHRRKSWAIRQFLDGDDGPVDALVAMTPTSWVSSGQGGWWFRLALKGDDRDRAPGPRLVAAEHRV